MTRRTAITVSHRESQYIMLCVIRRSSFISPRILQYSAQSVRSVRFVRSVHSVRPLSTIQQELDKFDSTLPVEKATTPPASWYLRPEFHELDNESVFRKHWIAVGTTQKLTRPGDYITGFLADEPYLVTRTPNNGIQAYYNVCRHHATLLMDEAEGHAQSFMCPYHGWTYGLDGRLTKARRLRGIQDFSAKNFCLKPIKTETWRNLVFICLSEHNDVSLTDWLKPLDEGLAKMGGDNMRFIERRQYTLACNWKVFIDNYLDGGYHVEYAHPALSNLLNAKSYKTHSYDGFSIQTGAGKDDGEEEGRVGSQVLYAQIFPNLMLNRYGPWLDVNYCEPIDAERCLVTFDWLLDEDLCAKKSDAAELAEFVAESLVASEQVQNEDIWLCERVQKGLRSRSYSVGRYAPQVEHADYEFHQKLAGVYAEHFRGENV